MNRMKQIIEEDLGAFLFWIETECIFVFWESISFLERMSALKTYCVIIDTSPCRWYNLI